MSVARLEYKHLMEDAKRGVISVPRRIVKAFPKGFKPLNVISGFESTIGSPSLHLDFRDQPITFRWSGVTLAAMYYSFREADFDEVRHQEVPEFVQVSYDFETGVWDDMRTERLLSGVADHLSRDADFRADNRFWRKSRLCHMELLVPYGSGDYVKLRVSGMECVTWIESSSDVELA